MGVKNMMSCLCLFVSINTIVEGAACRKKPLLFNFGDSNSDTGGASALQGTPLEFPEGRAFFHHPTGRTCDGRLILDFLCESVGTKYLTPYLAEQYQTNGGGGGVNFALGGSDTLRTRTEIPYRLDAQIAQFHRFHDIAIRRAFINAEQFRDNALYLFDIGQNDIDGNFDLLPFHRLLAQIPIVISKVKAAILSIYDVGGRNFWVHNTGPLGCLPKNVAKRNASTPINDYGCIANLNEAASKLNSELHRLCRDLRLEMDDHATLVYVDVHSIKLDLIVNHATYGFGHPFTACRDNAAGSVCPEAEGGRYLSWDGVHYTEAANMLVATNILSTNFSTPPLHFNFFCN